MTKNSGIVFFYLFLIVFVILAYLYHNNKLTFIPKKVITNTSQNSLPVYTDKEYHLDFTKINNNQVVEIASFSEKENWTGNFELNNINKIEGETSYSLSSNNNNQVSIELAKNLALKSKNVFKMYIYADGEENIRNIDTLALVFEGRSKTFKYDINNLNSGWNLVRMPKENFVSNIKTASNSADWDKINKVRITLSSRPQTSVELSLDRLWDEENESYQKDVKTENANMISLMEFGGKTYLDFHDLWGATGEFTKITGVTNFSYTLKIIPREEGVFGLVFRFNLAAGTGYFFELGGIGQKNWELYKISPLPTASQKTILKSGQLDTNIQPDKPLWLKTIVKNNTINVYLSDDGISYRKNVEKTDNDIKSGSIGLVSRGGSFLVESVDFTQ